MFPDKGSTSAHEHAFSGSLPKQGISAVNDVPTMTENLITVKETSTMTEDPIIFRANEDFPALPEKLAQELFHSIGKYLRTHCQDIRERVKGMLDAQYLKNLNLIDYVDQNDTSVVSFMLAWVAITTKCVHIRIMMLQNIKHLCTDCQRVLRLY